MTLTVDVDESLSPTVIEVSSADENELPIASAEMIGRAAAEEMLERRRQQELERLAETERLAELEHQHDLHMEAAADAFLQTVAAGERATSGEVAGATSSARSRSRSPDPNAPPLPVAEAELAVRRGREAEAELAAPAPETSRAAPVTVAETLHIGVWTHGSSFREMMLSRRWGSETQGRVCAHFPRGTSTGFDHVNRYCQVLHMSSQAFYVGVTEDPIRRWRGHASRFSDMAVLIEAPSSESTGALERRIIEEWRSSALCLNIGQGGESLTRGSPHYLYVCTRSDGLLRYAPSRRRQ